MKVRKLEIYPNNISLCQDGCTYDKINFENQRINCTCNIYLLNNNINNTQYFIEEFEHNFFEYLIELINYKIIVCYDRILDINNYRNNFGFFVGIFLYLGIFICMLIYFFKGTKSIKLEYLHREPNIKQIKEIERQFSIKNNIKKIKPLNKLSINKRGSNISIKVKKIPQNNPNKKKKGKKEYTRRKKIPTFKYRITNGLLKSGNSELAENSHSISSNKFMGFKKDYINNNISIIEQKIESIDYYDLTYIEALEKENRSFFQIFFSLFFIKIKITQILFYKKKFTHFSLMFSLYFFELLLDMTINSLLFSEDIITEKYKNNGELLFITTTILSLSSNIISYFILNYTEILMNQQLILNRATQEIKRPSHYYKLFIKLSKCFKIKIIIFYIILLNLGLFCTYYLFIFCAIYKQIQKNLFINYIISCLWCFGFTVFICLFVSITRKLSLKKRIKRLYLISNFIDEKF